MNKISGLDELRKYQRFLISLLILTIVYWLTMNYFLPNVSKIQQLQTDVSSLDNKIAVLQKKADTLSVVDQKTELDTLKKIVFVLPEEKDVSSIFTSLDELEKDSSVFITQSDFRIGVISTESGRVAGPTPKKNYESIDIAFSVTGTRNHIIGLLNNLKSFKTRLFTARNVSISVIDDSHISASFILTTYYSSFPPIYNNIESPLPVLTAKQNLIKNQISKITLLQENGQPEVTRGKSNLFQ